MILLMKIKEASTLPNGWDGFNPVVFVTEPVTVIVVVSIQSQLTYIVNSVVVVQVPDDLIKTSESWLLSKRAWLTRPFYWSSDFIVLRIFQSPSTSERWNT